MVTRDPVEVLRRLRRAAKDEAERNLAARLAEEDAARQRVGAAEARMLRERDIATDPAQGDGAVEAYIAWLATARRQMQMAQDDYERAAADVTLARAALSAAHAAEAADEIAARRSQAALDEIAARPTAPLG